LEADVFALGKVALKNSLSCGGISEAMTNHNPPDRPKVNELLSALRREQDLLMKKVIGIPEVQDIVSTRSCQVS
jgi:hypothetical protein